MDDEEMQEYTVEVHVTTRSTSQQAADEEVFTWMEKALNAWKGVKPTRRPGDPVPYIDAQVTEVR